MPPYLLTEDEKKELISTMWTQGHEDYLTAYFDYYQSEVSRHYGLTHEYVMFFVRLLKANPSCPREELQASLENYCRERAERARYGSAEVPAGEVGIIPTPMPDRLADAIRDKKLKPKEAIATTLRLLLGLDLNVWGGGGEMYRITWDEKLSLREIVSGIFPKESEEGMTPTPIKQDKLRARYLEDHIGVRLVWTSRLPEHLELKTDKPKTLKIFQYVSLLEVAYDTVKHDMAMALEDSLKRCVTRGPTIHKHARLTTGGLR